MEDCQWEGKDGLRCLAGNAQYWVAWNGEMYPCGMLPEPAVRPFETGFAPAWEALAAKTAALRSAAACETCRLRPYCPACAAAARAETGTTAGVPDYACRLTEAYCRELPRLAGVGQ
jgi:radical SAM protein with 4Fe4S-binding SPASM domain